MKSANRERAVEEVQAQIRQVSRWTQYLRGGLLASFVALPMLLLALYRRNEPVRWYHFLALAAAIVFSLSLAEWFRRVQVSRLQRQLSAVPRRIAVVAFLRLREDPSAPDDTRTIADDLARQWKPVSSELIPSRAPGGRGDELSPE